MGNPTFSPKSLHLLAILVLFSVDRKLMAAEFHTIEVNSMLPDSVCQSSGHTLPSSSLKVVHKQGPCHKSTQHKTIHESTQHDSNKESQSSSSSTFQILTHDESRVHSINSQIAVNLVKNKFRSSKSTTLTARSGLPLGSGDYIVTVGLGSPKKDVSLIFDTGSDLTWTQCEPCVGSCYDQQDPIFNPSLSTTYANVTCNTPTCNQLGSTTENSPGCLGTTCIYAIQYIDQSFSIGYFAKDTLTLSPTEIINDFYFGCGQNNQGDFSQNAGLIGLARDNISIVLQTSMKYGQVFSYCLPSTSSGTGYLTFGKSSVSRAVQYTPFANSQGTSFYFIDILAIYVGGKKLPINSTAFSITGSIIDSGTDISRLPAAVYTALRDTFRKMMTKYPTGKPISILDTCYDFSKYKTVKFPTVSFVFGAKKKINLDGSGILYVVSASQTCLAFAPNNDTSDVTIFGNVQQKTLQVVYDAAGGKLGFGRKGCA